MYIEEANFSLWCDFVERDFLHEGFTKLIKEKIINGATSNPAIFKSAFLTSPAYKEEIVSLKGKDPKTIYETLAIKDIQIAADALAPLFEKGDDGFVSIEVDPSLCDDAKGTIEEGERLFQNIGKPNVMIKVPATNAGFEAMEALLSQGIPVNATLIFSPDQAKGCLEAFSKASQTFQANHPNTPLPKAVISIFVSRFDRKLDPLLEQKGIPTALVGIYNATKIYHLIEAKALSNVRSLFASTGVKGDNLPKAYYVTELLFPNTINTAPLETIEAFVQSGIKESITPPSSAKIDAFLDDLAKKGISLEQIYNELMDEGLEAFKIAFKEILDQLA